MVPKGLNKDSLETATGRLTAFAIGVCRSPLLLALVVGLCCSAGLVSTAGNALFDQAGSIDPYLYLGYIHDYPGLLSRFGPTYYSTRIAFIYPEHVFAHFFGAEGGYLALRFVALASAAAAVFAIGMRFYGFAPALLAAIWLTFTPWLPRSLSWTYPDGVAVVYVLVGTALLVVPTRRRLIYHVAAGAAFAFAVNCNLFVLAICGLLGPGWTFFYRQESVIWLARGLLALVVGFFAAYLAMSLFLYIEFPSHGPFFELVSIRTAILYLGGQGQVWFEPLSSIWEGKYFTLLIPIAYALAALFVVARGLLIERMPTRDMDFAVLVACYLTSTIVLSLIFHFGFHDAWLSTNYYVVYFVPGCVLAILVLGGEAKRRGGRIVGNAAVLSGAALILLSWLTNPLVPQLTMLSSWGFWLAVAAVPAGAALTSRRPAAASAALVGGAVLLSLCLYQDRWLLQICVGQPGTELEWDVYRGAIFFQKFVNANVGTKQSVGFWYSGEPVQPWKLLDSIQSMYLAAYTRLFRIGDPGMPLIDEQFRRDVAVRRFVVLLGITDAETDRGLAALEEARIAFRELKRTHFQGQEWGYTAVLVDVKPGTLLYNVPTARLWTENGASVSSLADGLRLITAATPWTYSLAGRLQSEQNVVNGRVVVRVRLLVEEGEVGVAASAVGNNSNLLRREDGVEAGTGMREVDLPISDATAAELLIIQNESSRGPSRVVVYSVDVLRPNY